MTWSSSGYVIAAARAARWTAAAFAISDLCQIGTVIAAAEAASVPVILEIAADPADPEGGAIPRWMAEGRALIDAASVPVALHLAAPPSRGLMRLAAQAGFSSVRNVGRDRHAQWDVTVIRRAAFWAHEYGLLFEARFGRLGGSDGTRRLGCGAITPSDPARAARFVASTEIDLLSVGVQGCESWSEWKNDAEHDSGAVARLCDALPVPLSLYGAACPPSDLLGAEGCQGVVKVDIGATTEAKVAQACAVLCPA